MISEVLHLSVALNRLEQKIKNATITECVTYPSQRSLNTRRLIEYAKPMQLLGETINEPPPVEIAHTGPDAPTDEFKASFQEVLRLAKSGQQAWWTEKTKQSTDEHISRVQEYYETYTQK